PTLPRTSDGRVPMQILLRCLWTWAELPQILRADGWLLRQLPDGAVLAECPDVTDEQEARLRLLRLGLLTSNRLRLDFLITDVIVGPRPGCKPPGAGRQEEEQEEERK